MTVPKISEFVFKQIDSTFPTKALEAKQAGGGIIIGGENYGQGSSREHAAMAPMYLGIKAIINKSFARIHRDNLINFGLIPLKFVNKNDYDRLLVNDILEFKEIKTALINNDKEIRLDIIPKKRIINSDYFNDNIFHLIFRRNN